MHKKTQSGYSLIEALLVLVAGIGITSGLVWGVVEARRMQAVNANAELMAEVLRASEQVDKDRPLNPAALTSVLDERFRVGATAVNSRGQTAMIGARAEGGFALALPAVPRAACEAQIARIWGMADGLIGYPATAAPPGTMPAPGAGAMVKNVALGPTQSLPSLSMLSAACGTGSASVLVAVIGEGFPPPGFVAELPPQVPGPPLPPPDPAEK